MKTAIVHGGHGERLLIIFCPGCQHSHAIRIARDETRPTDPLWSFDGNREAPSVHPSLLVNKHTPAKRCHLFLRRGEIEFLRDCCHDLKGQTVPLPDLPDDYY